MQIHIGDKKKDNRRVDFHGNSVEGIHIELVDEKGITYFSKQITETERMQLVDTLIRTDNGRAV